MKIDGTVIRIDLIETRYWPEFDAFWQQVGRLIRFQSKAQMVDMTRVFYGGRNTWDEIIGLLP